MANRMSSADVKKLEQMLREECGVYEQYLKLLSLEQKSLTSLNTDELIDFTEKRAVLTDRLADIQRARSALLVDKDTGTLRPVREVIKARCASSEQRTLLSLANKLVDLIQKTQVRAKEMGQMLHFSLSMINGTISLIYSATQNVTKAYGQNGMVKNSYHPKSGKGAALTKEA